MNEKRFSLEYLDNMPYVKDNFNGDEYYLKWAVELINELVEQIHDLKAENERLKLQLQTKIIINKQYEEKEKLKKCVNQLEKENKILHQRIQILREEIQSTRQILKMQIDKLEGY